MLRRRLIGMAAHDLTERVEVLEVRWRPWELRTGDDGLGVQICGLGETHEDLIDRIARIGEAAPRSRRRRKQPSMPG